MAKPASGMQLSKEEVTFLERSLSGLPTSKQDGAGTGEADGLLKFKYHQNPYLRVYANVLWSGYAVSRGQIAEGHQRFSAARRDGQVSAVDAVTAKAMQDAQTALEDAMAPDGTIAGFLQVLREGTVQRLWSRVCETSGLPPPRFGVLLGRGTQPSREELDAAEEKELAALRKSAAPAVLPEPPGDDDVGDEETDDEEGDEAQAAAPTELRITVANRGGVETAAELVLTAATEAIRQLRVKGAIGTLSVSLTIEGQAAGPKADGAGGQRRRRRRRR
ncbi:MAG: hypothetical protein FJ100_10230 [Deltaproteobacteria bacterium]|nr:hypothetical protein [Deltaproteobacteria bacterium]